MSRSREEWIALYERKTGRKYQPLEEELCSYHPEHGYLSFIDPRYTAADGVFEIHVMVGDGKFWARLIRQVMKETGLTKVRFLTWRDPETIARRYGARVVAHLMEVGIDEIKV